MNIVQKKAEHLAVRNVILKAVFFAYMLPFLLVLTALLILLQTGSREVVAGTVSLCILGTYYLVLYLFRSKLSKEIVFKIKKLNT